MPTNTLLNCVYNVESGYEMALWYEVLLVLQADLCRLPQNLVQVDAVLAVNLLERLPNPALFLDRLSTLVKATGIVVLASAFSWSEECTAKDSWLGGFYKVKYQQMDVLAYL